MTYRKQALALLAVAAAATLSVACSSDDSTDAADTTTATKAPAKTTTTENPCPPASAQTLGNLGVDTAYTFGPVDELGNGKDAYYVATPDGAVWVTGFDPAGNDAGLILPLNSKARSESEMGADASASAPIYNGIDASSPGAVRALDCASDPEQDG